jgi:hypothetical protein
MFEFGEYRISKEVGKLSKNAKEGDTQIEFEKLPSINPGQWVVLSLNTYDTNLIKQEIGNHPIDQRWTTMLKDEGVIVRMYYQVKKIKGNQIELHSPIGFDMDIKYPWKILQYNPLEEIGVENIAFRGTFTHPFVHHRSWVDDSGWNMFHFNGVVNSWMKDCRFTDVSIGVMVKNSAQVSVLGSKVTGNGTHEAIQSNRSTNVFIGKCSDKETGTTITFYPDAEIFSTLEFDFAVLKKRLQEIAFLNAGLKIILKERLRIQKQAGIINESQYNKLLKESAETLFLTELFEKDLPNIKKLNNLEYLVGNEDDIEAKYYYRSENLDGPYSLNWKFTNNNKNTSPEAWRQVTATVFKVLKDFIETNNPKAIYISGDTKSKTKLYKNYIEKFQTVLDNRYKIDNSDESFVVLRHKDINSTVEDFETTEEKEKLKLKEKITVW